MDDEKKIAVYIVDDSAVSRDLLAHIIQSDPQLKVAGFAVNGEQALRWLKDNTVDVVTMDIHMPVIDGFEVTRTLMETKPLPIIIISSRYKLSDTDQAFRAMEVGALAILEKPEAFGTEGYYLQVQEIIDKIKIVSGIKLMKLRQVPLKKPRFSAKESKEVNPKNIEAIGIGASLGGPIALSQILKKLPKSFPVPVLIVQHIAAGFTEGLVKWLQESSLLPISLAKDKQKALPGHIYVAPDKCHMMIGKGNEIILDYSPDTGLQPSIARLFKSMAETYNSHSIGVILTGMGRDGVSELLQMKKKGAYTIAQDEESCIVFGMPGEAVAIGAVSQVIPIEQIGDALNTLLGIEERSHA